MIRDRWLREQIAEVCAEADALAPEADAAIARARDLARRADDHIVIRKTYMPPEPVVQQAVAVPFTELQEEIITKFVSDYVRDTTSKLREEIAQLRTQVEAPQGDKVVPIKGGRDAA